MLIYQISKLTIAKTKSFYEQNFPKSIFDKMIHLGGALKVLG